MRIECSWKRIFHNRSEHVMQKMFAYSSEKTWRKNFLRHYVDYHEN